MGTRRPLPAARFAFGTLALAMLLPLIASACDLTLFGGGDESPPSATTGAEFFLPGDVNASIASFIITGEGPKGDVFGPEIVNVADMAAWRSPNLALGSWTFTVEAMDAADGLGTQVGIGTSTYEVSRDSFVVPVDIGFPAGSGTFGLALSWTLSDLIGVADVEMELVAGPDAPLVLSPVVNVAAGTATLGATALTAGQYLLSVRILADGFAVWGKTESLVIYADAATNAAIVVPNGQINRRPSVAPVLSGGAVLAGMSTTLTGLHGGMNVRFRTDGVSPTASTGSSYTSGDLIAFAPVSTDLRVYAENRWGVQPIASAVYTESNALYTKPGGSDANAGTAGAPKATIQAAVDRAVLLASLSGSEVEVRVAAGAYTDADGLVLNGEVRVKGGYDALFNEPPDRLANPTSLAANSAINGAVALPNAAVLKPATYTGPSAIEGFDISNNAPGSGKYTAGILAVGAGTLTIVDCRMEGGSGSFRSYGVAAIDSSPEIRDSELSGGTGTISVGIFTSGDASPSIYRNRIWGGSGTTSRGVLVEGGTSSPSLVSNAILAIGAASYGIELYSDTKTESLAPRLLGNTIVGGSSALRIDDKWGKIVRDQANCIFVSTDGSPIDFIKLVVAPSRDLNNAPYGTLGPGGLADALSNDPLAIGDDAAFFSFDWSLAAPGNPSADALAIGGADLGAGFDFDLAGAARSPAWSVGAMERDP